MNAMQPVEGKVNGGSTSGQQAVGSGRLLEATKRSGEQAREFAASSEPNAGSVMNKRRK